MKLKKTVVDYRKIRLNNINSDEFKHVWLLIIFWAVFAALFAVEERIFTFDNYYHPVHCFLDDIIPFNEWFIIPYMYWFVFVTGMFVYTMLYDIRIYKRFQYYMAITYLSALIIYLIYPTEQLLRPAEFERNNILTWIVGQVYSSDTSTNVCPSIHVMGACAVWSASMYIDRFRKIGWQIFYGITTILICMSTVFMKQHSVIDVFCALPVCAIAHYICFVRPARKEKQALTTEKTNNIYKHTVG